MTPTVAHSDVVAADDAAHFQDLPEDHLAEHFQDHIGIGIFGKAGDKDILFVCTIYHVGGRQWGIKDGAVMQTNLVVSPTDVRTMGNNSFVANRLDPIASFDNFVIESEANKVTWRVGQREIISQPPHWHVKGEHMGVDVDLHISGLGKSIPYHGTWDKLAKVGVAGNEQLGCAEGRITYKGETYTLDEGWAVRERTCLGKGFDVPTLLGAKEGYLWGWVFSEQVKVFCFAQGGSGHFAARVFHHGGILDFGAEHSTVEALESWTDPLTHATQTTAWRLRMQSEGGSLELHVRTWSRYLFGFHLINGYTTHTGALGRANGRFTFPDKRVVEIEERIAYFEQGFATPLPAV